MMIKCYEHKSSTIHRRGQTRINLQREAENKMKTQVLKSKSRLSKGVQCVIGGFILCLSFSSDFSYPNINSYLTSYMGNSHTNGYNNNLT